MVHGPHTRLLVQVTAFARVSSTWYRLLPRGAIDESYIGSGALLPAFGFSPAVLYKAGRPLEESMGSFSIMRALDLNRAGLLAISLALSACGAEPSETASSAAQDTNTQERPSILLVTLDTTRADALGIETDLVDTPALEELATRGLVFSQAYATAPMTLPAHTSILTGLYPTQHGIHENGRRFADSERLLATRLQRLGYRTAAFVSAFPLAAEFGLASGFDHYDDELPTDKAERPANETTGRALGVLEREKARRPCFLWVHYFDPHEPYEPPEPYRSLYSEDPYLGEIAFMDRELGRSG